MFLPSSYSTRLGVNIMILSIVSNHDLRDLSFFKYIAGLIVAFPLPIVALSKVCIKKSFYAVWILNVDIIFLMFYSFVVSN
mmetsp:Transcript_4018/g.5418  ORF Transcript_4018/g.5418 Transcript_4018/m.5418 type:complete len:81 (-) Transcript_4018:817-1059(-)